MHKNVMNGTWLMFGSVVLSLALVFVNKRVFERQEGPPSPPSHPPQLPGWLKHFFSIAHCAFAAGYEPIK